MSKGKPKQDHSTLGRRSKIIEILNKRNDISVSEICKMFNISEVSVRNDFAHLEKKGLLIRTRGGAISKQPSNFDLNLNQRLKHNYKQKQKIGKRAVDFIKNGNAIIMDSGSTAIEVARNLDRKKNLRLITNSLPIAEIVADNPEIEVIIAGGTLRPEMRSLVGSMSEQTILNYYCDVAILGADSIDSELGLYTQLESEASLTQTMIKISKKTIVVTDSSKFGKKSFVKIASIPEIDIIITDKNISQADIQKIQNQGVELVLV
jgi:DeoR family transcriptional regulator of aga operon